MKKERRIFALSALPAALLWLLMTTTAWASAAVWGQGYEGEQVPAGLTAAIFLVIGLFVLAAYVYFSLSLQTIAKKTNTPNAWLAWIPIANVVLMLNIAKKPIWWLLLFFIPVANMIFAILVWMAIAEARGKPNWWGILLIVPVVGIIVPGYLAFSD